MKSKFIAIISISTIFMSFSFLKFEKATPRPPGTVKIVENFFFDKTEISNIDWKEYLSWLKKEFGETSEKYLSATPDRSVWLELAYAEVLAENYFDHPSYDGYPVVGISYDQVVQYCEWRTKRVKEMWALNHGSKNVPNFRYRLPTKTEWELVANTGFKELSKKEQRRMKNKPIEQNYNIKQEGGDFFITAPCYSYLPNKHGMYNLYGNVAEMVSEEGVAKGGSWNHNYNNSVFDAEISYEKPSSWLGFRCVCEIIE
ncbi:MAG: formylglycine-generating enzyme family protein [Bacteroidetes bacterium]|jgi:formylglycine-generating enzyme required for sulfatase activity|nr:formylglycine-generating enzyme family protein [Bacteroidota bacterium]